jgi:hypothetical protein
VRKADSFGPKRRHEFDHAGDCPRERIDAAIFYDQARSLLENKEVVATE